MKLRRLATTVAATSALVLTGTVPAIADHAEPDHTFDGNLMPENCDDERLAAVLDYEYISGPWDASHPWWHLEPGNPVGETSFNLVRNGGGSEYQLAVLVKGGNKTNLFVSDADESMPDLFAPADGNSSDTHPTISHYFICKVKSAELVPPDEEEPPPDEEEPPPPEETKSPEPEETKSPEPEETTPAAVPTEIPAGTGTADAGTAGTAGLVAMIAAFAAGAAVIIRRRFLTES